MPHRCVTSPASGDSNAVGPVAYAAGRSSLSARFAFAPAVPGDRHFSTWAREHGHSPGTACVKVLAPQGLAPRPIDWSSADLHGEPRRPEAKPIIPVQAGPE
jgi:hypothetical protein